MTRPDTVVPAKISLLLRHPSSFDNVLRFAPRVRVPSQPSMASSLLSLRASSFPSSRTRTRTATHSLNSKPRRLGTGTGGRRYFLAFSSTSSSERAEEEKGKKDDEPGFNPFGFVTDNPSSRSAIQLPESPAEDGNVGQMLYRIEDKGREYGSYVRSGKLRWFVRETGSANSRRGTILFLHGAPTQSFSYREVMSQMSSSGYHCFAPDWIGFGFSDKPQPGYGFNYTEDEFHSALEKLLEVLNITSPFILVVQVEGQNFHCINQQFVENKDAIPGFLVGSFGLTWALKNSEKISKIPLFGEFTCQNAIEAERFIEGGSPYVLKNEKADVYRLPYLSSGAPGFALLEAAKKANFGDILGRISSGFSSSSWDKPILLVWGLSDKYLPLSEAEALQKGNPDAVQIKQIEGAGHMPQEDWPEKVVEALRKFL